MNQVNEHGGDAVHFEPFTPPSTEELDALIPGYKFLQFIERGGMGAVYKAVQKSLNRTVAVKLLPQVHRNKESFAERFKREAHALALLNHPHIIAVYDFGETPDGQMYYVMEFVSGMDLQQLLKRDPPEPRQILKIITQVCEALQFAHEHGIVHRDIKPANILVDERGNVKVADFGLAKVIGPQSVDYTATGMTIGTPDYIAPEALDQSRDIDHRADIYSLGVMIYELFTGHVPKGVWEPPSIRSGADKGIDAVVSKAMQNNPEKRYQHVRDMTQVLEKLFKNSDNWKNFRRQSPSLTAPAGKKEEAVPTGAVTLKIRQDDGAGRRWLPWVAAALLLLGGGFAVAWQSGLLAASEANPKAAEAGRPLSPDVNPQQMALARFVVEHGGVVNVQTPASSEKAMGGSADLDELADLPSGAFTVWRVSFLVVPVTDVAVYDELVARIRDAGTVSNLNLHGLAVPTDALKSLVSMPTLTSLDLMSSPAVTAAAIPYIAACRQLRLLRIGGIPPLEGAVLEQLRALLPDCGVHDDK
ncbi:MAG: serine/threonine-protein kinase [Prosthecobacter sp.]|uniref:serine/threonine-protein kinase n=1 Tax=Prosthecobacter sp. TaxID=1965333 RepID=UPI003BB1CC70